MNGDTIGSRYRSAGFWIRATAFSIDAAVVGLLFTVVSYAASLVGIYVPVELDTIVVLLVYSTIGVGRYGCTVGKWACRVRVMSDRCRPIGYVRALLRETAGKAISVSVLGLGCLWVGIVKGKRGWHDYLMRTVVVRDADGVRQGRRVMMCTGGLVIIMSAIVCVPGMLLYYDSAKWYVEGGCVLRAGPRHAGGTPIEAGHPRLEDRRELEEWLAARGEDPIEYAVRIAKDHEVTIFGEYHEKKEYLELLNRMIPELYHRSGVTCLAMEVVRAEDNAAVDRLITAEAFDSELAMEIARHESWKCWGWREYWDVLHTVWQLNRGLNAGQRRMRVVGLGFAWDGPSYYLVTQSGRQIPLWERLRILRLAGSVMPLLVPDGIYASNVEREITEKGERAVVWVGAAHATIHVPDATVRGGHVVRESARMGYMLQRKYGGRICHVMLHKIYDNGEIGATIENVVAAVGGGARAFDLSESPFGRLRDANARHYRGRPDVCLRDIADGYIVLGGWDELHHCEWMDGYISREMFGRNRPYYEAQIGRRLGNANETNRAFANGEARSR